MGTLADIYPVAADQVGKIKVLDDPNVSMWRLPSGIHGCTNIDWIGNFRHS